jgi:hypothetical protein
MLSPGLFDICCRETVMVALEVYPDRPASNGLSANNTTQHNSLIRKPPTKPWPARTV